MSQEQTSNTQTNADSQVSFTDVSLTTLKQHFKNTYKVSKGAASQVVLGFNEMGERLGPSVENEYQQTLYPKLKQLCKDVYTRYETSFFTSFDSDVERQVFGANLNGNRNNGSLYRSIPSGVNRTLTYNYAQFGQLMRVLVSRLKFISQRDPNSVQRYKDNQTEFNAYQKLQTTTNTFLDYLTTVSNEWNTFVTETRTKYAVGTDTRQPRQNRQSNQSHGEQRQQTRQRRQYNTEQTDNTGQQRTQYKQVRRTTTQPQRTDRTDNSGWTKPRVTTRNSRSVPKSSVTV